MAASGTRKPRTTNRTLSAVPNPTVQTTAAPVTIGGLTFEEFNGDVTALQRGVRVNPESQAIRDLLEALASTGSKRVVPNSSSVGSSKILKTKLNNQAKVIGIKVEYAVDKASGNIVISATKTA